MKSNKEKYYMVRYDGRMDGRVTESGHTFAVKATHSNIAIAKTHQFLHRRTDYKKPFARVISEDEFNSYDVTATSDSNVKWNSR